MSTGDMRQSVMNPCVMLPGEMLPCVMHPGEMRTDVMVLDEMHRQPGICQNLEFFSVAFIFCVLNIFV